MLKCFLFFEFLKTENKEIVHPLGSFLKFIRNYRTVVFTVYVVYCFAFYLAGLVNELID